MKKYALILVLLISLFRTSLFAQNIIQNIDGTPLLYQQEYVDVKGSPFLFKEWKVATLYDNKSNSYPNVRLNYDLVKGYLIFQEPNTDRVLKIDFPVDSFILYQDNQRVMYERLADGLYYKQIVKGSAYSLYLKTSKNVMDTRQYASASTEMVIVDNSYYYYLHQGELHKVLNNKKSLLSTLTENDRLKTESFLKQKSINVKKEEGLIAVFENLNSN